MTLLYSVRQAVKATDPISGRQHSLEPGDTLTCDAGQTGTTILIEINGLSFLVERATFKACCEFKNEGPADFLIQRNDAVPKKRVVAKWIINKNDCGVGVYLDLQSAPN